ncbi:hypothetical protein HDU67_008343 [Dinochytrium kinnereticum]|nr:hypothetical protein HDU67_008343 [Dinochytrium kinnereticum]
MTRMPGATAQQSAATLGGWQVAANKHTKNVEATVKAIQMLISREFQMERFKVIGLMPTVTSLYSDPEFCRLNPECGVFGSLQVAARPAAGTAPYYLAASEQIYLVANKILRDELSVTEGLKQMTVSIQKAIRTYVEPSIDLGPPIFVDFKDSLGLAFMITAGLMAFFAIALFVIILMYRKHKLLTSSSPVFMLFMVLGTLVAHGAIFAYTGEPSRVSCILQPWLVVLSYSFTVAALVTKNWRIFKIFRNKYMMKMNLKDSELLKTCLALISVNIIILIVWTAVDPPQKALIQLTSSQFFSCRSKSATFGWGMIGGLLAYNALLLGAGVYLAYCTRNVQGPFNESKYIGYTIYTMVLLNIILIPLSYIEVMGAQFQYVFRGIAIELSAVAVTINMFLPKIIELLRHKDDNVLDDSRTGSNNKSGLGTGSISTASKTAKNIKNVMSDMMEGVIYVRYGKSRFAMSMASWKDMNMIIIPASRFIAMFPSDKRGEKSTASELGISFLARSIIVEDIAGGEGLALFSCVLNGTFYEIQVATPELKEKWMKMLNDMIQTA